MPLLFWYLPFMIMSGAFDTMYGQNETQILKQGTQRPRYAGWTSE
jgi:hypothetical protein